MSHISGFRRAAVAVAAVAALALPSAAPRAVADMKPGGFMSANVEWVGTLPVDSPGVGGRVVRVGDQTRFYVTGVKGLTIYDVTDPALPVPLGHLPLPHWENEDVAVSADGRWVIVSHDGEFQAMPQKNVFTYIVDAGNPQLPTLASMIPMGAHTSTCADDNCDVLYGSDGWTWDLTDKAAPKQVTPGWGQVLSQQGVGFQSGAHDLTRDAAGYFVVDSTPRVMFDPRPDPRTPRLLTTGGVPSSLRLAYQHNNLRPNADQWRPRLTAEDEADPNLRPGEILLSNGETNFTGRCGAGSGPFATWTMRDWDKGARMRPLHVFRPVNGTYADGDPAANAMGCSGHWFSERGGIVAAGWYDHGTRFLQVNQATGHITEVGYFQPVAGEAFAAHWINDEYVYVVDMARGIDILRFDRDAPAPTTDELKLSWSRSLAKARLNQATPAGQAAAAERWRCDLAQR